MQFAAEEIGQLTQDIFSTMLQFDVTSVEAESLVDTALTSDEPRLTACVQIAGAWKGAVVFDAPSTFARQAAAVMFDIAAADATAGDVQDALAELVNMIGGNLKTLLPGPSFLSLPAVTEGNDYSLSVPGSRQVSRVRFDCRGDLLDVVLLEEEPVPSRLMACVPSL